MTAIQYVSTRQESCGHGFADVLLAGLASDGGLFIPDRWPRFEVGEIRDMAGMRYEDVALKVIRPFVSGSFKDDELEGFIEAAYSVFSHEARSPLVQVGPNSFLLELFHGPTLAFKDFAMQLVSRMLQAALEQRGQRATIVGATSGDTGSAAIEAFRGMKSVDVFILYPDERVSDIQRRQMTTPADDNVHAMAIDGSFDDCQALVKGMFNTADFRAEMNLAAVNSINWARIVAQTVYYFFAAVALGGPDRKVSFSVPTGNFGDIYSAHVARRMGLPIQDLVIATNQNDILHRTLSTGVHQVRNVRQSISPSMDIQVSSNFERILFEACGGERPAVRALVAGSAIKEYSLEGKALDWLQAHFRSGNCSEDETRAAIRATYRRSGQVVCPHTAVGLKVADEVLNSRTAPVVSLATAHPAKFPDAVEEACGVHPELPEHMAGIHELPERICRLPNQMQDVTNAIRERVAA